MRPDNKIVQGFWMGDFTTMERLCVKSFLANGHEFHLYCYEMPKGVPDGVVLRDAAEIVPWDKVETFRCAQQFSDYFRIALLLKRGGWHSDMDNCCLKTLDFSDGHVFYSDHDESTMSLALSKAPAGSRLLQHCYDHLSQMSVGERERLSWQEIGAEFVQGAIEFFHMEEYAQPGYVFDPVHHTRVREIVDPRAKFDLSKSYSVHLFHAAWNNGPEDRMGRGFDLELPPGESLSTDGEYPPGCLYQILKEKYGEA